MQNFSNDTSGFMALSGWTKGRIVDTTHYEDALREAGFSVHDAALSFLKHFGGLSVSYPHAKVPAITDKAHFDPLMTIRHIRASDVLLLSRNIGKQLCVVGEAARGYLILMMDEEGLVYASYDDYFALVGQSGVDAIDALCTGREIERIPLPEAWNNLG